MRIDGTSEHEAPSGGGYQADGATGLNEVVNGGSSVLYSKNRHNSGRSVGSRLSNSAAVADDESFLIAAAEEGDGVGLAEPQKLHSLNGEEYGQQT